MPPPGYNPNAAQPVYQQPQAYVAVPVVPAGPGTYAIGKEPVLAVLLSFLIPGVGQFYCGDAKKGGIMLAVCIVSWILTPFIIGFIPLIGVWIWSMVDAYNIAARKTPIS